MTTKTVFTTKRYVTQDHAVTVSKDISIHTASEDLILTGTLDKISVSSNGQEIGSISLSDRRLTFSFDENISDETKKSALTLLLHTTLRAQSSDHMPKIYRHATIQSTANEDATANLLQSLKFRKITDTEFELSLDKQSSPYPSIMTFIATILGIIMTAVGLNTLSDIRQTKDLIRGSGQLVIGLVSLYFAYVSAWDKSAHNTEASGNFNMGSAAPEDTHHRSGENNQKTAEGSHSQRP